jgi:hypothetical protein
VERPRVGEFTGASAGERNDAAQTHRREVDSGLPCLLADVFGWEWNPRWVNSVVEFDFLFGKGTAFRTKPSNQHRACNEKRGAVSKDHGRAC